MTTPKLRACASIICFDRYQSPSTATPKFTLRRTRLNRGGYDRAGAYYGIGEPLFYAQSDCLRYEFDIRATDRDTAKAIIKQELPLAQFYR